MMITIHGLPITIKYQDLKTFIKQECNVSEFILDSLVNEADGTKKVRVGLADDMEGGHIIKCLDGFRMMGHILRIVPVGKSVPKNVQQQNSFDMRGNFQPRNDYPSQGFNEQRNNRTQEQVQPAWSGIYPSGHNQWSSHQPPQIQNNFDYQQSAFNTSFGQQGNPLSKPQFELKENIITMRGPNQGYQYQYNAKSNLINLGSAPQRNNLSSLREMPEASRPVQGRYPVQNYDQDKKPQQSKQFHKPPLNAAFDNKPYNDRKYSSIDQIKTTDVPTKMGDLYKSYDKIRQHPPQQRAYDKEMPYERPHDRDISQSGRGIVGKGISPTRRPFFEGRKISPERSAMMPGRNSSPGRRGSPPRRRASPIERRISHFGRRISPSGRLIPPVDRDMSSVRRFSPSSRSNPPVRQISPTHTSMDKRNAGRLSPSQDVPRRMTHRHESPRRQEQYSSSHHEKPDYQDERRHSAKSVRPAYEPPAQASDEAMYSSSYHPNVREDVQYPARPNWEDREKPFPSTNIDDRRDDQREMFDLAREKLIEQDFKQPRSRSSRSPRRDRSPMRDRFRRHSPSPLSPRRSWALEKRQSPVVREPPPPPMWPGKEAARVDNLQGRMKYNKRELEETSHVWLPKEKRDEYSSVDKRREYEEMALKKEMSKWKPIPQTSLQESSARYEKESKFSKKDFSSRREFDCEEMHKIFSGRQVKDYERNGYEDRRYKTEFERKLKIPSKKEEYAGRIEEKKKEILHKQEQLQKEFDDVYKRAVDFTKKTELYRKGEHKRESNYDDRRRKEDHNSKNYEKRFNQDSFDGHSLDEGHRDIFKYESRKDNLILVYASDIEKSRFKIDEPPKRHTLIPTLKDKRVKATEEIAEKLLCKYGSSFPSDILKRVEAELKWTLGRKMQDLFGDKDLSFIEMVVMFNSKHSENDEEKIFDEVMSSLPSQYRHLKRTSQDESGPSAKSCRRSPDSNSIKGLHHTVHEQQITDWNTGMLHPFAANQPGIYMNAPVMVPLPTEYQFLQTYLEMPQTVVEDNRKDDFNLYLCKNDFTPIVEYETDKLKEFLVQQLIKVTETSTCWAPDFTFNKQHSAYRHEVVTRDERSKDWLLNLDFSEFDEFSVLVYTTEELWYERAAIWLPGHSRCRKIEPLTKLKLQNRKLEGINIGKWKLVKKIVMDKGTRIYVDMPPSSARALENQKMLLSYELQKVNVFLKAVAIDKDAFDAGLNEPSIKVLPSPNNSPMPSLGQDPNVIKIAAKGNKPLNLMTARKLKDIIIYKLFKYHQLDGKSRTDFVKYGFCQPGFLGILPENDESRKWLCILELGKINRQPVIIVGADEDKTKYFKMKITLPRDYNTRINTAYAFERLRQSNQGVKGINFNLWKDQKIIIVHTKVLFEVEMDMESIETLSKMNYKLDYVGDGHDIKSVNVESEYPKSKLEVLIAKYKEEMSDTYDISNMDLASSESDDDVICLD